MKISIWITLSIIFLTVIFLIIRRFLKSKETETSLFGAKLSAYLERPFHNFYTTLFVKSKSDKGDFSVSSKDGGGEKKGIRGFILGKKTENVYVEDGGTRVQNADVKETTAVKEKSGKTEESLSFKKIKKQKNPGGFKKGHIPWNKGKKGYKIKRTKPPTEKQLKALARGRLIRKSRLSKKFSKGKKPIKVTLRKSEEEKRAEIGHISFQDALSNLKDNEVIKILEVLRIRGYHLKEDILNKTFKSEKELLEFLKQNIINFLNEYRESLKERISKLRRQGKDVESLWLKLMSVPLKIKLFEASFTRRDFDNIIKLIDSIEKDVKKYESEKPAGKTERLEKNKTT